MRSRLEQCRGCWSVSSTGTLHLVVGGVTLSDGNVEFRPLTQLDVFVTRCFHKLGNYFLTRLFNYSSYQLLDVSRLPSVGSGRELRSSTSSLLKVPFCRSATTQLDPRALAITGPASWNSIPLQLCLLSNDR